MSRGTGVTAAPREVTIVAHDVHLEGGMERQLHELVQGLLVGGWRVTVVARRCDVPAHPGLHFRRIRTRRRPFPLGYVLFALEAGAVVRRHARGPVHVTGAIIPNRAECATVHFCHVAYKELGHGPRPGGAGRLRALSALLSRGMAVRAERWCYRSDRVDAVVAVSPGVEGELRRFFPALPRLEVVPHGVDGGRFRPVAQARASVRVEQGLAKDALVALFVGGDWKRKRLEHALRALARAPGWELLVVGRGDEASYAQLARELGVEQRVRFAGIAQDVQRYFAAGDVFVLPTEYETFCLVAFEAATTGLPLLVTPVSGPDLLIEEGINGAFLDDDPARTGALLRGYEDADRRRKHGAAARRSAEGYTWDRAVQAYERLYGELAADSAGPSR